MGRKERIRPEIKRYVGACLAEGRPITINEVAEAVSCAPSTADRYLIDLKRSISGPFKITAEGRIIKKSDPQEGFCLKSGEHLVAGSKGGRERKG